MPETLFTPEDSTEKFTKFTPFNPERREEPQGRVTVQQWWKHPENPVHYQPRGYTRSDQGHLVEKSFKS